MSAVLVVVVGVALRAALRSSRRDRVWRRLAPSWRFRWKPWTAVPVPRPVARLVARRRDRAVDAALPGAMRSVARSLRSGASLQQALAEAAATEPLATDLGSVVRSSERGLDLRDALAAWRDARPTPAVRLVVTALIVGHTVGGPIARAIDGVADTLDLRASIERETVSQAASARASALVIALAPVAFGVFAASTDPRTASFLVGTPLGLLCLAVALALDGLGAVWMARIVRSP